MLSKMNIDVDRCNDFYSYACESFISDVTIPPSDPRYSTLSGIIEHRTVARLRKVWFHKHVVQRFVATKTCVNLLTMQHFAQLLSIGLYMK